MTNTKMDKVNNIIQSLTGCGYLTEGAKVSYKKIKYCGRKADEQKEIVIWSSDNEYVVSINVAINGMLNCHLWLKGDRPYNENFRHTYGAWDYVGKTANASVNEVVRMIDRTIRPNRDAYRKIIAID